MRALLAAFIVLAACPKASNAQTAPEYTDPTMPCVKFKTWKPHGSVDENKVSIRTFTDGVQFNYKANKSDDNFNDIMFYSSADITPGTYTLRGSVENKKYNTYSISLFKPGEKIFPKYIIEQNGKKDDFELKYMTPASAIAIEFKIRSETAEYFIENMSLCKVSNQTTIRPIIVTPAPAPAAKSPSATDMQIVGKMKPTSKPSTTSDQPAAQPAAASGRKLWAQQKLATATVGYDSQKDETLLASYYLAVTGPASIQAEVWNIARDCITSSLYAAYQTFNGTPSPEISVRVGAAMATFQASAQICLSASSLTKALADKFDVGLVNRAEWTKGLSLQFSADNPTAQNYEKLHEIVKKQLPEPLNQIIKFYIDTQKIPAVDIKIEVPDFVRKFVVVAPPNAEILKFQNEAMERMVTGKKLISKSISAVKSGSLADIKDAGVAIMKYLQLDEKAAEYIKSNAPKLAENIKKEIDNFVQNVGKEAEKLGKQVEEKVDECAKYPGRCATGGLLR